MDIRVIDHDLRLVPYYPCDEVTLSWYQDPDVVKQVDDRDEPYDLRLLHSMYTYLSTHGSCYYIEYQGTLVGDITLRDNAQIAIVVSKPYQNRHIGRRCVAQILRLAREKQHPFVTANIYSFNTQSKKMFESMGFVQTDTEWYRLEIT